jgi:hypothetical protein
MARKSWVKVPKQRTFISSRSGGHRDIDLGSANIGAPGIGVVDPKHAIVLGLGAFAFDMLFLGQKLFFALHSFGGPSMGSWPERRKKSGHSAKTGSLARQAANPGE